MPGIDEGEPMRETRVTVKFDGQAHQVDIDTFVKVMLGYSRVLRASAEELGESDGLSINITATEVGSLDAVLSIFSSGLGGLFSALADNRDGLESVVILAGAVLGLRKKLGGKKNATSEEDEDGRVSINVDGSSFKVERNVYNVYTNPRAESAMDSMFETLDDNPEISGLGISMDGEQNFSASREEFTELSTAPELVFEDTKNVVDKNVKLVVVRPVLAASEKRSRKWEFVYQGYNITAPITDEKFLSELYKYSFTVGTVMTADVERTMRYESDYRTYVNKSYRVMHVLDVENPPEETPLF